MYKVRILSVGKNKESWLEEALQEYSKRLTGTMTIELTWVKNSDQLTEQALKENAVALDPQGQEFKSEDFAKFLDKKLVDGGSRLTFVIGDAEGLPPLLRQKLPLISLSKLTFTHQIARLILIEQIYRSLEILKGSEYHK